MNQDRNGLTEDHYDDDNIPDIDTPKSENSSIQITEPIPESERPRKDGPGGE